MTDTFAVYPEAAVPSARGRGLLLFGFENGLRGTARRDTGPAARKPIKALRRRPQMTEMIGRTKDPNLGNG